MMDIWTMAATTIVGGVLIYLWHNATYFKRHGLLHKTTWPLFGNMLPVFFRRHHFLEYVSNYYKFWPDAKYFGFQSFLKPIVIVRDLELIKAITVKSFENFPDHDSFIKEDTDPLFGKSLFSLRGSRWRETRTILSPAFTASKMRQMFELMEVCAKDLAEFCLTNANENIKNKSNRENDVEIKDVFSKYTNDVIATCAFGISVNSLKDPNNKFYLSGKNVLRPNSWQNVKFIISQMFPFVTKIVRMPIFDVEVCDFFLKLVEETVETRRRENIVRPDMIQLMMEAKAKTTSSFQFDILNMTAQAFVFFIAGFETTGSLMAFTAIQLAKDQDIQNKLIQEIDDVVSRTSGSPSYEVINSMPYLEAILYETLRFFPVSPFLDRLCVKDFEFPPALPGLKPFTVKAGTNVWIPSYAIHNDPQHYDDPHVYQPERFLNQKMNINSPTYLSFGIGPRSCIGNRFALLESKLVLFNLLSKCRLEMSSKMKRPITYSKKSFILQIEGGYWVKIVPRHETFFTDL